MWTMKHRPHAVQVDANPRTPYFTDLRLQRSEQLLHVSPGHIRTYRFLKHSPKRFTMPITELHSIILSYYQNTVSAPVVCVTPQSSCVRPATCRDLLRRGLCFRGRLRGWSCLSCRPLWRSLRLCR